jgi:hypothetical protein
MRTEADSELLLPYGKKELYVFLSGFNQKRGGLTLV